MTEPYAPDAFWMSKLSDYRRCPRLFKLKHLDKVKVEAPPSADQEFGTAMHLGCEDILRGGEGIPLFAMYWDTLKGKAAAYTRHDWEKLREMGEVFLARFKRLHAKHFEPFKIEERIHAQLGPHKFEGTPDFVGSYKGKRSIVDFKTAGFKYDKSKIICDEQMPTYAALVKQEYGYDVEQVVYIVFVKSPTDPSIQTLVLPLTSGVIQCTIDNVIETCDDLVARKSFPRNPGGCLFGQTRCAMWDLCHGKESNNES